MTNEQLDELAKGWLREREHNKVLESLVDLRNAQTAQGGWVTLRGYFKGKQVPYAFRNKVLNSNIERHKVYNIYTGNCDGMYAFRQADLDMLYNKE